MIHFRKFIVAVTTLTGAMAATGVGWAYWGVLGSGAGSAAAGSLAPPTGVTVPATSTGAVSVSWTASSTVSPNVTPEGYYVERSANGTTWSLACASSPTVFKSAPCSDTAGSGTYTYRVTAAFRSWTARSAPSAPVTVDLTAPTVASVSSSTADGSYPAGTLIPLTVTFSEPVIVTGTPQLTLSTGSPATTIANYTSGSATNTLVFNYTIVAGNTSPDLNYASTSALALNGGTIRDPAGNNATLALPPLTSSGSLATNKNLVIDTTAPIVTITSHSNGNGASKINLNGTGGRLTGDGATVRVYVCRTTPCSSSNNAETDTVNVATNGTWSWQTGNNGTGTWYAKAEQADAAGNIGTFAYGPFTR